MWGGVELLPPIRPPALCCQPRPDGQVRLHRLSVCEISSLSFPARCPASTDSGPAPGRDQTDLLCPWHPARGRTGIKDSRPRRGNPSGRGAIHSTARQPPNPQPQLRTLPSRQAPAPPEGPLAARPPHGPTGSEVRAACSGDRGARAPDRRPAGGRPGWSSRTLWTRVQKVERPGSPFWSIQSLDRSPPDQGRPSRGKLSDPVEVFREDGRLRESGVQGRGVREVFRQAEGIRTRTDGSPAGNQTTTGWTRGGWTAGKGPVGGWTDLSAPQPVVGNVGSSASGSTAFSSPAAAHLPTSPRGMVRLPVYLDDPPKMSTRDRGP